MSFKASDVKKLREMTGAGMMACKTALTENNGDIDASVDYLRTKGLAAAQKKQSRIAAEGTVATYVVGNKGVVVEINCETDFVSKGDDFQGFAHNVATHISSSNPSDIAALKESKNAEINELTLKLGEKIDIRRFNVVEASGVVGNYNHGGKIGVLVSLETKASGEEVETLARDIAMHVAAIGPTFISADEIDQSYKDRESAIYKAQLLEEGKPENMIEKIIIGKLGKLAKDVCLLEQPFVKDGDVTVKKLIGALAEKLGTDIKVSGFVKVNLGEGIEKKEDNLADEVAKLTGKQ